MPPAPRKPFRVTALQMTSTPDVDSNVDRALAGVRRAARRGADLVALPENFAYLREEGRPVEFREALDGPLVSTFRQEARRLRCHVLLGSIPERVPRSRRVRNTSVLIAPDGDLAAVYRKLHLFDIRVKGKAELRESRTVQPGDRVVVADTSLGKLGLSICYDLRFPELYRRMAFAGAELVFVPAAFTAYTGPFHWLTLLRARAIENQCWIVAPAQVGRHSQHRRSHGESVIVDPWGDVLARKLRGEGSISATVDPRRTREVRRGLPALSHVRPDLMTLR